MTPIIRFNRCQAILPVRQVLPSPEQAQGKVSEMNGHTDIFSMASFYMKSVVVSGLFGNTLVETLQAVVNDQPMPIIHVIPLSI